MSELGEALTAARETYADGMPAGPGLSEGMLARVRRRRARRAVAFAGLGAVSLSLAGVGAAAVLSPGPEEPTALELQCDLDGAPLPRTAALGDVDYQGRAYLDTSTGTGEFRRADGALRMIARDAAAGMWLNSEDSLLLPAFPTFWEEYYPDERHLVIDLVGGRPSVVSDPTDLWWEWTTDALDDDAPLGLDPDLAARVHAAFLLRAFSPVSIGVAGTDVVIERMVTYQDGDVEAEPLLVGGWVQAVPDLEGVASVTTRFTMPEGAVYDIVSTRAPAAAYAEVCGENDSVWQPVAPASAVSDLTDASYEPYLSGPESAVFQCGAVLDPALEQPVAPTLRVEGVIWDESVGVQRDFGAGATVVTLTVPGETYANVSSEQQPTSPGWEGTYPLAAIYGGAGSSSQRYVAPVWVDTEGRIVATLDHDRVSWPLGEVEGFTGVSTWTGGAPSTGVATIRDDAELVPCCESVSAELAAATPVILYGEGATADTMTWMWFPLDV